MNAGAMSRMIRVSWVLLLAVLVVGAFSAQEAGALPNTGKYKASISKRVGNFTDFCESLGGSADVSYSYDEDGKLVSANASCSGGDNNGSNCTFTDAATECYREPGTETLTPTTRPNGIPIGEDAVVQSPEVVGGSGVVRTNLGSPGVVDAGATEQSTHAAEPAIVLIAAGPMTVQVVADDQE